MEENFSGEIYWLDDNIEQMLYVVEGAFPKFWNLEGEEKIRSRIIIFGNNCDERDSKELCTEKEEAKFRKKLRLKFVELCQDIDGPQEGNATFDANQRLIEDSVRFLFKKDCGNDEDEYQQIKNIWISGNLGGVDNKKAEDYDLSLIHI